MNQEIFRSVAHQGYSVTNEYYGNCRLSSYTAAAEAGFDYAETDLKFTADNIPVCTHDHTFVDTKSGTTEVVIAETSLAELKTYGYHGETIATLDEVLFACKTHGIGLYIDHLSKDFRDEQWETIFSLVKTYAMEDHVAWLTVNRGIIERIQSWYSRSAISLCTAETDLTPLIALAKEIRNDWNKVAINALHSRFTVEQVREISAMLPPGISLEMWTVDDPERYRQLLPYLSAITSNKICAKQLLNHN